MNIENLVSKLARAKWFSANGTFSESGGKSPIRSLAAWDSSVFAESIDAYHAAIAAKMDWLPTSKDQVDPFYGDELRNKLHERGAEASAEVMKFYKQVMKSVRNIDGSKLVSGPNDFSEAAVGAALYCARMTAIEVVIGKPGVWGEIFDLYCAGYWPCGRLPDGAIIVY